MAASRGGVHAAIIPTMKNGPAKKHTVELDHGRITTLDLATDEAAAHEVGALGPNRIHSSILIDIWGKVEEEFAEFEFNHHTNASAQPEPSRYGLPSPTMSSTTRSVRRLLNDSTLHATTCPGYMDKLLPTITRLRCVDAVAGTALLQQFALIGTAMRTSISHAKLLYELTSTLYRLRESWVRLCCCCGLSTVFLFCLPCNIIYLC